MSKRQLPADLFSQWLRPYLQNRGIRHDLAQFMSQVDRRDTLYAAKRLASFDRPALVVWAAEDRVMPPDHGRRLTAQLPHGRLVEVQDSYTLIPHDQPTLLASQIRQFINESRAADASLPSRDVQ